MVNIAHTPHGSAIGMAVMITGGKKMVATFRSQYYFLHCRGRVMRVGEDACPGTAHG